MSSAPHDREAIDDDLPDLSSVGQYIDWTRVALTKYGATNVEIDTAPRSWTITFDYQPAADWSRTVRMTVRRHKKINEAALSGLTFAQKKTARGVAVDYGERLAWRDLLRLVHVKFRLIRTNRVMFDDEFGQWVVLPDGRTVSETFRSQWRGTLRHDTASTTDDDGDAAPVEDATP